MRIRVKRLHPDARLPQYSHGEEDGAADLSSVEGGELRAGEGRAFGTGLAVEIPRGFVGLIWDRSGLAFKQGMTVLGGMIDAGYRGEVRVYLHNTGSTPYRIEKGDRIAQLLIVAREYVTFEESEELTESVRGERAFGSSGKS